MSHLTLLFCREWSESEEVERLSKELERVLLEPSPKSSCKPDSCFSSWNSLHLLVSSDKSAVLVDTVFSSSLSGVVTLISSFLSSRAADSLNGATTLSACKKIIKM